MPEKEPRCLADQKKLYRLGESSLYFCWACFRHYEVHDGEDPEEIRPRDLTPEQGG